MGNVLVTGSSGFVGGAVVTALLQRGTVGVVTLVRRLPAPSQTSGFAFDDLAQDDFHQALAGVDCVVHAAARVHVLDKQQADSLAAFRQVNVQGTLNLARQAATAGVRRFVFISSVKVNGEQTDPGQPFAADAVPAPVDAYGISKREAEQALLALAQETTMEVVIIRPVLVYGPGVKANFHSLMHWLVRGVPLPLGAINNRRSLVALDNLVDLILTCIEHPHAANQVFLVSDGDDVSTTELLRRMAQALGKPSRLLPVPAWLLRFGATLLGKGEVATRLCGSLQVDISKTRAVLGWTPPQGLNSALQCTAKAFLEQSS